MAIKKVSIQLKREPLCGGYAHIEKDGGERSESVRNGGHPKRANKQKAVCLLLNLGGFESRMTENLEIAQRLGRVLYSLTGDGLVKVERGAHIMPVNVLSLSPAQLLVWSSLVNEQLQAHEFDPHDAIILCAGKKYRGSLPIGTAIAQGISLGA